MRETCCPKNLRVRNSAGAIDVTSTVSASYVSSAALVTVWPLPFRFVQPLHPLVPPRLRHRPVTRLTPRLPLAQTSPRPPANMPDSQKSTPEAAEVKHDSAQCASPSSYLGLSQGQGAVSPRSPLKCTSCSPHLHLHDSHCPLCARHVTLVSATSAPVTAICKSTGPGIRDVDSFPNNISSAVARTHAHCFVRSCHDR